MSKYILMEPIDLPDGKILAILEKVCDSTIECSKYRRIGAIEDICEEDFRSYDGETSLCVLPIGTLLNADPREAKDKSNIVPLDLYHLQFTPSITGRQSENLVYAIRRGEGPLALQDNRIQFASGLVDLTVTFAEVLEKDLEGSLELNKIGEMRGLTLLLFAFADLVPRGEIFVDILRYQ